MEKTARSTPWQIRLPLAERGRNVAAANYPISVRLSRDLRQQLAAAANVAGISISTAICRAVEQYTSRLIASTDSAATNPSNEEPNE